MDDAADGVGLEGATGLDLGDRTGIGLGFFSSSLRVSVFVA